MSLESEVANLVSNTSKLIDYFNTKKAGIDASVAAAVAAVPNMYRVWYVNQQTGDDAAVGTQAAPLKSIEKAIASTPVGGTCAVRLMSDYVHTSVPLVMSAALNISSDQAGVKRKFSLIYKLEAEGNYSLTGFGLTSGSSLGWLDITLVLPSPVGLNPVPSGGPNAMVKAHASYVVTFCSIKFSSCDVQAPADFVGFLMIALNNACAFEAVGTSFPTNFAGRYIQGVAAGAAANTLPNVLTNLPTL